MVAFLLVFIASRTARWHALQLVRRSSLISPRTGFNSGCIRKESCTTCQQHDCVRWCHHLCLVRSCRSVDRLQATSFLSAIGVGLLIAVLSGVFTARQMKNELCVSPHSFEVLAVGVRSRIQNELGDFHLLHEHTSLLLARCPSSWVPLGGYPSGVRLQIRAASPDPVHCFLRGRRCTAAPNVT